MEVTVISATERPLALVGAVAGLSTGRGDPSEKRVVRCFGDGHMGVFEHVSATFRIEGISRACSHQLVRHRLASFVQLSQRYTRADTSRNWYAVPPSMEESPGFAMAMEACAAAYRAALDAGVQPEDARYLLPEAAKTSVNATMNLREFYAFLDLREAPDAQWEIRELAHAMEDSLAAVSFEWERLLELRKEARDGR